MYVLQSQKVEMICSKCECFQSNSDSDINSGWRLIVLEWIKETILISLKIFPLSLRLHLNLVPVPVGAVLGKNVSDCSAVFSLKSDVRVTSCLEPVSRGLTLPHYSHHVRHGECGAPSQTSQEVPSVGDIPVSRKWNQGKQSSANGGNNIRKTLIFINYIFKI